MLRSGKVAAPGRPRVADVPKDCLDRRCRLLLAAVVALGLLGESRAQGTAQVVGQSLAWLGLAAGALAGAIAGFRRSPAAGLWPAFGIYLGLLAMVASTRAASLEIVPLTLVLGAVAGIVPFAAAWFLVRWCWNRLCGRARRATGGKPR